MSDGLGEVGLADAGLAADQGVAALADEGAGGEVEDLLAVDARIEAEVEQLQGLGGIDRATADPEVEPLVLAALGLVLDQARQELDVRPLLGDRLLGADLERVEDAGEAQAAQVGAN